MANNDQIILELVGKTTKLEADLKRVSKALDDVGKKTKKVSSEKSRWRIATEGARRSIGALRNNMLLVSFALGGTAASVGKLISAYGQQQLAERKLQQALGFTSKALLGQASALQQTTAFGDEAIIGVQALIGAFTQDEEQIKSLTQTTLDLAAAKGMDLNAAADLVSKSFGSSTNALSRYGIQVEGAVGSTERLENLTSNVAELFGGQAAAQADTMTGSIQQMQNAMGDTAEAMGSILEPSVIAVSDALKTASEWASDFFNKLNETELETIVRQLSEMGVSLELINKLEALSRMQENIEILTNSEGNLKKIMQEIEVLSRDQLETLGYFPGVASDMDDVWKMLIQDIPILGTAYQILGGNVIDFEKTHNASFSNVNMNTKNIGALIDDIAGKIGDMNIAYGTELTDEQQKQIQNYNTQFKALQLIYNEALKIEQAQRDMNSTQTEGEGGDEGSDPPIDTEAWDKFLAKQKAIVDTQEEFMFMMAQKHIAYAIEQELLAEWIENNKELAKSMGIVTDAQKDQTSESEKLEKQRKKEGMQFLKNIQTATKGQEKYSKIFKAAAITETTITTAQAMMAAYKALVGIVPIGPVIAPIAAAAAGAAGAAQIQQIAAAQYGMNEVVDEPTLILAGENNQAESVQITPLEGPNIEGVQGGGASVVVNVSGNLLTSDFVEGELADNIREAVRRGTDFGIG